MSDFDLRRIGEIATLEDRLRATQENGRDAAILADRWTPKFSSFVDGDVVKISLQYDGRAVSAIYKAKDLVNTDVTSATTTVLETLFTALISDALRPLCTAEVAKAQTAARTLQNARSQW